MTFLTLIPEIQLSTFACSFSLCPSSSSPFSTQVAVPTSQEPNTAQPSNHEMHDGNNLDSGSESDLSDFESESSCSELEASSRAHSIEPRESPEAGGGPAISYYHLPSTYTHTTIYAPLHYAAWSYNQLWHEFNISLSTLLPIIYRMRDAENKIKTVTLSWLPLGY